MHTTHIYLHQFNSVRLKKRVAPIDRARANKFVRQTKKKKKRMRKQTPTELSNENKKKKLFCGRYT